MSGQSVFTNLEPYWKDDFTPLQDAGKAILVALREDESSPNADLYRRIGASGDGSHRYFSASEPFLASFPTETTAAAVTNGASSTAAQEATPAGAIPAPAKTTVPMIPPPTINLTHNRSVPLPSYISKQLQSVQSISLMGLLPEAELAWMTVDSKLFLWPYTAQHDSRSGVGAEGPSFCSFIVPSGQCILGVGLAYPNRDVFRSTVHWCLVVTTTEEVILCALAETNANSHHNSSTHERNYNDFANGSNQDYYDNALPHRTGAFRLVPTKYTVPTDGVRMVSVCGTSDGRIFLGGEDGCLYGITYDSPSAFASSSSDYGVVTTDDLLDQFYDGGKIIPPVIEDRINGCTNQVVSSGKRALSVFGAGSRSGPHRRPPKCRKLNHSSNVSSFASVIFPDFLMKATSFVLGAGRSATGGGSIVKIVADEERSCLYTLGSKGWICAFSLLPTKGTVDNNARLEAVMNAPETARLYLDAVARSRMTPPQSSSRNIGKIIFPGDGTAAQKGVGGMDGARNILSLAKSGDVSQNVLTPISFHVIPRKEDGRATLVAVTRGGLRYYISSLASNLLTSGPPRSSERKEYLAPSGGRLSLLHIRAPPPLSGEGRTQDMSTSIESDDVIPAGGFIPRLSSSKMPKVNASFYGMGAMVLAVGKSGVGQTLSSQREKNGDHVVAIAPDFVLRKGEKAPGGVSETLSLPMSSISTSVDDAKVLPGGLVWDIAETATYEDPVLRLALSSQTPTDTELSLGLVPEFIPMAGSPASRLHFGTNGHAASIPARASDSGSYGGGIVPNGNGSLASTALTVALNLIPNMLLSRPLLSGMGVQKPRSDMTQRAPTPLPRYRVSNRHGVHGYSLSAADTLFKEEGGSTSPVAPRLNPRLLHPSVAPLDPMTIQHLLPSSQIVVMNAGGLQYFQFTTVLSAFEEALISAGENVEHDERISSFFKSYGHAEGCSMCIALAVGRGRSPHGVTKKLAKDLARRAAISRAFSPKVTPIVQGSDGLVTESPAGSDPLLPPGYLFTPSALLDGLTRASSRLIRPIWHKPLVVVTEGRTLQRRKAGNHLTPAKVELLLDDETLAHILGPIQALTELMKDWFQKAIDTVPGAARKQSHIMDIDEDGSQHLYITDALTHLSHMRASSGAGTGHMAPAEAERIAFLTEERKIHALFRLLGRAVQLLRLFSLLSRAHRVSGLPEIEWGSLHGLTISQLVQTRDGQSRLEKILNNLVASMASFNRGMSTPSSEFDNLANDLTEQCYLIFSPGAWFAYLGFSYANRGLACPPGSARRTELAGKGAECFKKAAKHWHNSSLVTGRSLPSKHKEGYEKAAMAANESGSPISQAAAMLIELGDVDCVVEICLITAANFSPVPSRKTVEEELLAPRALAWERQLYHRRNDSEQKPKNSLNGGGPSTPVSPAASAVAINTNTTSKDAVLTCWSLIFFHLKNLLQRGDCRHLAESMVSKCAGEEDSTFLYAFFQFMKDSGNTSTLLRVRSTALEDWLHDNPPLLYSYYVQQEKFYSAGRISSSRARNSELDCPFIDRIECLSKASNAYSSALRQPEENRLGNELGDIPTSEAFKEEVLRRKTEVEELLDIAKLQSRVLASIPNIPETATERKQLSTKLIDVNALYEIAYQLGLFDICLLIVHSCKENNEGCIEKLWKNVFCEAIFPCSTRKNGVFDFLRRYQGASDYDDVMVHFVSNDMPSENLFENGGWIRKLKNKVHSLGKEVYGSGADFVFPVSFILNELECKSICRDVLFASFQGSNSILSLKPLCLQCRPSMPICPMRNC